MWRNVFGHAIYQALIIMVVIFFGQGTICHHYDQLNLENGKNPFFSKEHYTSEASQKWWIDADYKVADFDQEKLFEFKCEHYVETHKDEVKAFKKDNKKAFDCSADDEDVKKIIDAEPTFLPQDMDVGVPTQKCLHFTYVFQSFVFMQVFNQINARKLELGEINVFEGIFRNMLFIYITIFTFVIQMAMVEYGGAAVKSYPLNSQ